MSPLRIEANERFLGEVELVFAGDHAVQGMITAIRESGQPSRDEEIMLEVPKIMPKLLLKKHRVQDSTSRGRRRGSDRDSVADFENRGRRSRRGRR